MTCAFDVLVAIEATTTAIEFMSDYDAVFEIFNELDEVDSYNVAAGESQFADIEGGESLRYRTRPIRMGTDHHTERRFDWPSNEWRQPSKSCGATH